MISPDVVTSGFGTEGVSLSLTLVTFMTVTRRKIVWRSLTLWVPFSMVDTRTPSKVKDESEEASRYLLNPSSKKVSRLKTTTEPFL